MGRRSVPRAARRRRRRRGRTPEPRRCQGHRQDPPDLPRGLIARVQHQGIEGTDGRTRAGTPGTRQRRGREQRRDARHVRRFGTAAGMAAGKQRKGNGRSIDVHDDAQTAKRTGTRREKSQADIRSTKEDGRTDGGRIRRACSSKTPRRGNTRQRRNLCRVEQQIQRRDGRRTRAVEGASFRRFQEEGKCQEFHEGGRQVREADGIPAVHRQGRNAEPRGDGGGRRKRPGGRKRGRSRCCRRRPL
mmetsp:Transcript_22285/g.46955  ORF Transcript_22285/g.46955 Transcript_22285/m.46955 type:complete len:245 (+) Transcript_22285:500-1234(+)